MGIAGIALECLGTGISRIVTNSSALPFHRFFKLPLITYIIRAAFLPREVPRPMVANQADVTTGDYSR
jgi:hypothetical protein